MRHNSRSGSELPEALRESLVATFVLKPREVEIFECLVRSGRQAASSVARLCEMPRNTVRGSLDNLVKKGVVTCTRRANTQYYGIERSEALLKVLEQRREAMTAEIEGQLDTVRIHREVFDRPMENINRPRISFYDGYEGLKKVYEDTLTSKTAIRAWASFDANKQALPKYFETYYSRRAKKKIAISGIIPDTPLSRAQTKDNARFLRKCVLVPPKDFTIGPEVQIYDGKVNIVSWKEKLGIIIESSEVATALAAIFDISYRALQSQYPERK